MSRVVRAFCGPPVAAASLPEVPGFYHVSQHFLVQSALPVFIRHYCPVLRCTPSRLMTVFFYKPLARTPRKTPSSIVNDACLLVPYLAMDVLLLHLYYSRESDYRVVA
jgi:hypothetical protein